MLTVLTFTDFEGLLIAVLAPTESFSIHRGTVLAESEQMNKPFFVEANFLANFPVPFPTLGVSKSDSESFSSTEDSLENVPENAGS